MRRRENQKLSAQNNSDLEWLWSWEDNDGNNARWWVAGTKFGRQSWLGSIQKCNEER